jgi:hypothetical protein
MNHTNRRTPVRVLSLAAALAALAALACLCSQGVQATPIPPAATADVFEPTGEIEDTAIPEPPPPTEVVETGSGFEVLRLDDSVRATTDGARPEDLLRVTGEDAQALAGMHWVTVDGGGQALLTGPACEAVYVYQNSGLTLSGCPAGGGTGMCSTGTLLLSNCDITVSTLSADVSMSGTWVSVTYLQESQVTLVIVGEGDVTVTPVDGLVFSVLDPDAFLYAVDFRELGDDLQIEGVGRDEPLFLYTGAPEQLEEIGMSDLARTWFAMDALSSISRTLGELDPQLGFWLDLIAEQAGQDDFELALPQTLVTIVDGEPQPSLAAFWEEFEEGLVWRFALDETAERADGSPYTAGLIVEVLAQEENGPSTITGYAGVEVLDDFTFEVYLEKPNPDFLLEIAAIPFPP